MRIVNKTDELSDKQLDAVTGGKTVLDVARAAYESGSSAAQVLWWLAVSQH